MGFKVKVQPSAQASWFDCAYIAGFLDGDGYIRLVPRNRYKVGTTVGVRKVCHGLCVGLTNRDLPVLEWIQARFGGAINQKARYSHKHSPAFELKIVARAQVANFVQQIGPFVRIKRPQIDLAAAYLRLKPVKRILLEKRGKTWPLIGADPADIKVRDEIVEEFTRLNATGVH